MLDKYGLNREDPTNFCLVQVTPSNANEPAQEYILEDDECPLSILMNTDHTEPGSGTHFFQLKSPLLLF